MNGDTLISLYEEEFEEEPEEIFEGEFYDEEILTNEEDYVENDIGEYDYDENGNISIDGGYNRNGYNRDGYDEDGLDEYGYDEDMNGAYDY